MRDAAHQQFDSTTKVPLHRSVGKHRVPASTDSTGQGNSSLGLVFPCGLEPDL